MRAKSMQTKTLNFIYIGNFGVVLTKIVHNVLGAGYGISCTNFHCSKRITVDNERYSKCKQWLKQKLADYYGYKIVVLHLQNIPHILINPKICRKNFEDYCNNIKPLNWLQTIKKQRSKAPKTVRNTYGKYLKTWKTPLVKLKLLNHFHLILYMFWVIVKLLGFARSSIAR